MPGSSTPYNELVFDDDYAGPRWSYGLTYRPLGFAAVPPGWIIRSDRPDSRFRFGTVDYPRELTENEVAGYQLEPLGRDPGDDPSLRQFDDELPFD